MSVIYYVAYLSKSERLANPRPNSLQMTADTLQSDEKVLIDTQST